MRYDAPEGPASPSSSRKTSSRASAGISMWCRCTCTSSGFGRDPSLPSSSGRRRMPNSLTISATRSGQQSTSYPDAQSFPIEAKFLLHPLPLREDQQLRQYPVLAYSRYVHPATDDAPARFPARIDVDNVVIYVVVVVPPLSSSYPPSRSTRDHRGSVQSHPATECPRVFRRLGNERTDVVTEDVESDDHTRRRHDAAARSWVSRIIPPSPTHPPYPLAAATWREIIHSIGALRWGRLP